MGKLVWGLHSHQTTSRQYMVIFANDIRIGSRKMRHSLR